MPHVAPFNDTIPLGEVSTAPRVADQAKASAHMQSFGAVAPDPTRFRYLFPDLQNQPAALLPESRNTVLALKELGAAMSEPGNDATLDSNIPSAYTYLGQFIDHDITLMMISSRAEIG